MKSQSMITHAGKRSTRLLAKVRPVAAVCAALVSSHFMVDVALANAGFGTNTNIANGNIAVPTYYANSPQGWQPALDATNQPITNPATGNAYTASEAFTANGNSTAGAVVPMVNTGTALRKFVDSIGGLGAYGLDGPSDLAYNNPAKAATASTQGIPVAIPVHNWVNPLTGVTTPDDYYELAVVEYVVQMHSDLPKKTIERGYVQIETAAIRAASLKDPAGVGSEHIPGVYPDGTPILDASGAQVFFVHSPHPLGPAVVATTGTAVRYLFRNYLPYTDAAGVAHGRANGGELEVPVDEILAGGGPLFNADGTPFVVGGKNIKFGQNRVAIHNHGGDTPWINDGTPHQWFVPAGDAAWQVKDPQGNFLGHGESFQNVPDMADPGPGSQTLYFPNNQSGRMQFYHDHASGLTRLNVYMGMAAGYLILNPPEQAVIQSVLGNGATALDAIGTPLVIQDRTFVPKNVGAASDPKAGTVATNTAGRVQSQDTKWNTQHWGAYGDLWFPHVYETNQDPNAIDGTNPVGRWDWGPWFWPVFPAQYSLPSGVYGDVTTTPEAFVDTPTVNGVVYPTMTVDPKTYRFRFLAAGNDRSWNLGLYYAVDGAGTVCDANNLSPVPNAVAPGETAAPALCTEMRMVPAASTSNLPGTWPADGRAGGVPDPLTIGPDIVQIGNETGLLPAPAVWTAQPVTFDQNVRSMTVFNVLNHQLLLAGAERADTLIDFSPYAGSTLILYNDGPAPMPGFDPRIDYFTNEGDQTIGGGSYNTLPGYGPNTRTVMQIKVNKAGAVAATPLNVPALAAAMAPLYAAQRPQNIIPETAYSTVFPTNNQNIADNYAHIYTGSNTAPAFTFPMRDASGAQITGLQAGTVTPVGATGALNAGAYAGLLDTSAAITVTAGGTGYTSVPNVTFTPAPLGANGAPTPTATAQLTNGVVTGIVLNNMDTGYFPGTVTPTIAIDAPPANVQATATLSSVASWSLAGQTINIASGSQGSGYSRTALPTVTINGTPTTGSATATAVVNNAGNVTGVTITGSAVYPTAPTLSIAAPATTQATATVASSAAGQYTMARGNITPTTPGAGYTNASIKFTLSPSAANGTVTFTPTITNGRLTRIGVTVTGTPTFASAPTVAITGGTTSNATASLTQLLTAVPVVDTVTVVNAGVGYVGTTAPTVTLTPGAGAPTGLPTAKAALNGSGGITISLSGNTAYDFTAHPATVVIGAPNAASAVAPILPTTASATDTVTITNGGSGYGTTAPLVSFVPAVAGQTATAVLTNGAVTGITLSNSNYAFATVPAIKIAPPPATTQATAVVASTVPALNRIRVINKAIQELFDPVYGRMNATLAVELPYSSATVATTIPLAYVDTPVDALDAIKDDELQIWKITHNGVDSHPVHFHLVNVQVINRVDWAGVVKPPEANEIGWKEVLRMNPLEDVYVAVRAERPSVPFGLPKSTRLLDPSQAVGGQAGFTQIDPATGNAPVTQTYLVNGVTTTVPVTAYSNQLTDFDNEYVWHCHILGHEENDFMRPFIFHPVTAIPDAPDTVKVTGNTVTWGSPVPYGGYDAQGIPKAGRDKNGKLTASPKNEIGFRVYTSLNGAPAVLLANVRANVTTYTDATGTVSKPGVVTTVTAWNAAGESLPGNSATLPAGITASSAAGQAIATSATAVLSGAATTASGAATGAVNAATAALTTAATNANAAATAAAATDAALAAAVAVAPVKFAQFIAVPGVSGSVVLKWANAPANIDPVTGFTAVTGYTLTWTGASTGTVTLPLTGVGANATVTGATIEGLTPGAAYTFNLVANAPGGTSAQATVSATAQ